LEERDTPPKEEFLMIKIADWLLFASVNAASLAALGTEKK